MSPSPLQTSETLQDLTNDLKSSLLAYSKACQEIRQYLINQFGYEAADANALINDLVRTAYGHQQGNS